MRCAQLAQVIPVTGRVICFMIKENIIMGSHSLNRATLDTTVSGQDSPQLERRDRQDPLPMKCQST